MLMYNNLFTIGRVTFHTYGLMIAIGILAAFWMAERRSAQKGLNTERIPGLVVVCVISGLAGAKILYLITILPELLRDPQLLKTSLSSGFVIFGGILGGIAGGLIYCRVRKLPGWVWFDMGMPCVALAQGFGRIGCFFAGCCYGVETSGPLAIVFHNSEFAPNGVPLVPTQLISSAVDFALFFFLITYDRKWKHADGEVLALYLVLYSLARFIVEFWRGDLIRGAVGPLSTSQFIGLFTFAAGVILFGIRRRTAGKAAEAA